MVRFNLHKPQKPMAGVKPVAGLLLFLNSCMHAVVLGIGAWAINTAVNRGFIIGIVPAYIHFFMQTHNSAVFRLQQNCR